MGGLAVQGSGDLSGLPKGLIGKLNLRLGRTHALVSPSFGIEELSTSSKLGEVIAQALQESSHLVIIYSPRSAQSQWVNEEIKYFKRLDKV